MSDIAVLEKEFYDKLIQTINNEFRYQFNEWLMLFIYALLNKFINDFQLYNTGNKVR